MARRYSHKGSGARHARKASQRMVRRGRGRAPSPWTPYFIVAPLAVFTAVFLWDGGPPGWAIPLDAPGETPIDQVSAQFSRCGEIRYTCVVDGDTIWYRGNKIRIADINTPELSEPECAREGQLAERATQRLTTLLNQGPFEIRKQGFGAEDADRYGRLLRVLSRDGESLGEVLVREGYAETWKGYRGSWC
jgi:micrococcal nuclease